MPGRGGRPIGAIDAPCPSIGLLIFHIAGRTHANPFSWRPGSAAVWGRWNHGLGALLVPCLVISPIRAETRYGDHVRRSRASGGIRRWRRPAPAATHRPAGWCVACRAPCRLIRRGSSLIRHVSRGIVSAEGGDGRAERLDRPLAGGRAESFVALATAVFQQYSCEQEHWRHAVSVDRFRSGPARPSRLREDAPVASLGHRAYPSTRRIAGAQARRPPATAESLRPARGFLLSPAPEQ